MTASTRTVLVTGCAGFIGSALVRQWLAETGWHLVGVDHLGYAGLAASLDAVAGHPRWRFVRADIADGETMAAVLADAQPQAVVHLAAESHVDRSLTAPAAFIHSNLVGTAMLLEAVRGYLEQQPAAARQGFRYLQVSTDEVFGALGPTGVFDETSPYRPNSPYSASKAGADHLARAWRVSHGLPVLTTYGVNTYGPRQMPEKLIPRMIVNALAGADLPVYGSGAQVRDWLHVDDHARALRHVLERGEIGEAYCIPGTQALSNLELVQQLCALLDVERPAHAPHARLIRHVPDRPGHDFRYAMDGRKLHGRTGWQPSIPFAAGLADTLRWYLANPEWLALAQRRLVAPTDRPARDP